MKTAKQLFSELQVGQREYMCGMMTYDTWRDWQVAVAKEAQELGLVNELVKLLDRGGE
jgi:hypothetical protein